MPVSVFLAQLNDVAVSVEGGIGLGEVPTALIEDNKPVRLEIALPYNGRY